MSDVSELSARVGKLEDKVGDIREDVASMKERLTHLPTTAALWRAVAVSAGAVILALWVIVQFLAKPWVENLVGSLPKH